MHFRKARRRTWKRKERGGHGEDFARVCVQRRGYLAGVAVIVGVSAVEPSHLRQDRVSRVICWIDVLWSIFRLHRIDEVGGVVVAPLFELSHIKSHKHAVAC